MIKPAAPVDLLSLQLHLRPLPAEDPARPLPPWWGRAAHALLLNAIRQVNPTLAEALHSSSDTDGQNTIRPFTASALTGRFRHASLDPQSSYRLRFTALRQDVAAALLQAVEAGPLAPGQVVDLDGWNFQVAKSEPAEPRLGEDWNAAASYAGLSAALLLAKTPAPRRVALGFASPTAFKSGGKHLPVPLPELVFGSLLERWNAFAPVAFPPEMRRYAAECLALSRYQLSTRAVAAKSGGMRVGSVGEATYTTINYDRYWMSLVGVLAEFALYSGVGVGTAFGMGQCRAIRQPGETNETAEAE